MKEKIMSHEQKKNLAIEADSETTQILESTDKPGNSYLKSVEELNGRMIKLGKKMEHFSKKKKRAEAWKEGVNRGRKKIKERRNPTFKHGKLNFKMPEMKT